ncbi:MAG TPA: RyR domain-containing protein [Methanoregula sp.]|nr:RyR domain-containing protein [Methanoregula sp.]
MSSPDVSAVIAAFLNMFSQNAAGEIVNIPAVQDIIGTANSAFLRTAFGAFAGSGFMGAVYLYFREEIYLFPLRIRRNHTIVCGLNYHSFLILRDLARRNQKPVIIEEDSQNSYLDSCKMEGITVIIGNPADKNTLLRAGIKRARYILAFGEDDETNAEVALQTIQIAPRQGRQKISPVIQIRDPRFYMLVRRQAFSLQPGSGPSLEFFNQYLMGAKLMLDHNPPLVTDGPGSPPYPVIVFGAGDLGEMITTRIARSWYGKKFPGQKPQIFLVDINAEKICRDLGLRYSGMKDACTLIPVEQDVNAVVFGQWALVEKPELEQGYTAYICFSDDSLGLHTASMLADAGYGREIQVIVRVERNHHVARLIAEDQKNRNGMPEIVPVDMNLLTADSRIIQAGEQDLVARAIHEFYCRNQRQRGETPATNKLLVSWDELGELTLAKNGVDGKKFQESNRNQARMIRTKLNGIGYDIGPITDWDAPGNFRFSAEETEYLAALEHERWMQEKQSGGWRYGTVRDDRKKTHPSIIPYNNLSEPEKEKDRDTVKQIPAIISLIDFQIYRRTPPDTIPVPAGS